MPSLQALTRVAEDYLKAIWSAEEWASAPITAKQLVERFGISAPTVSVTLKRLAGQGLLLHEAYGPIELTPEGRRHALAVVRRHRLLETYLVRALGYDWAEVHEEAEELEHAVSDRLIERIDAALGRPEADPHGDPIPSADGVVRRPQDVRPLDRAEPGPYRVVRVSDADPAALVRLGGNGIVPGQRVDITGRRARIVEMSLRDGETIGVPLDDATAVLLEPVSPALV